MKPSAPPLKASLVDSRPSSLVDIPLAGSAEVINTAPQTTEQIAAMGANAFAPSNLEPTWSTDINDCFNHSDWIGSGLASWFCPCVLCGQLSAKQGRGWVSRSQVVAFFTILTILAAGCIAAGIAAKVPLLFGLGGFLAYALIMMYGALLLSLRRRIRMKWSIPSPRCCFTGCDGVGETLCCFTGCDDVFTTLCCPCCVADQLARQEYLASNNHSVEYDFCSPNGEVPGVPYKEPPV